jgi:hypothetical protein
VYLRDEHSLGRVLDYAVIGPRLQALHDWSAAELGQPELRGLITDGRPGYVWAHTERHVWDAPPLPLLRTMLGRVTMPPDLMAYVDSAVLAYREETSPTPGRRAREPREASSADDDDAPGTSDHASAPG